MRMSSSPVRLSEALTMENRKEEAPNVVTEPRFRELLSQGFVAEIICQADCNKRNGHWYGEWILRAIDGDGTKARLLVKVPRYANLDVEARVFKTVNGLLSFMLELGFATANIPVREGHRTINTVAQKDASESSSNSD